MITLQKCDLALSRAAAVHGPADGAGGVDVLHGGEHGDAEHGDGGDEQLDQGVLHGGQQHGDGGDEQHGDERQLDEGLANADGLSSSSCLSGSYLLFNPGAAG